jgi:hypothetical protein
MAYDVARKVLVLLGINNSTWTWDGVTWTQLHPATSPCACSSDMAYDGPTQRIVLFAGGNGEETWTWDGVSWVKQTPARSPVRRANPALASQGATGQVVLFGGAGLDYPNQYLADTWTWDGSTWTEVGGSSP